MERGEFVKAAGTLGVSAIVAAALWNSMGAAPARGETAYQFVKVVDLNGDPILLGTEDTLKLVKTNLDSLLLKAGVLGGRTWAITETVPISHANLDAALSTLATQTTLNAIKLQTDKLSFDVGNALKIQNEPNLDAAASTLAKETGGNLATVAGKDFATQATLALIKAKTDNLDAALSTLATATGQSTTQPRNLTQIGGTLLTARDWSVDFGKLDVALSTLAKESGGNLGTLTAKDFATQATLALIKAKTDNLDVLLSTIPDVSDRAARLLGIAYGDVGQLLQRAASRDLLVQLRTATTEYDARQIRTLTSTDVVDIVDKAARLLGVVYGSRGQQLLQTATNFNSQVELATAATLYDARQIRTLTTADEVKARVGNSINSLLFASIDVALSGDNTIVALDASNKIKVTDYSIVADAAVAARWKSGASTNLSGAMSFATNGGIMAAAGAGRWLFETAVNQALVLNLGAAVGARGHVTYFKESS